MNDGNKPYINYSIHHIYLKATVRGDFEFMMMRSHKGEDKHGIMQNNMRIELICLHWFIVRLNGTDIVDV